MWCNILKICLVLCVVSITLASHTRQVTTTILNEFPKDCKVSPYVRLGNKLYYFSGRKASWDKATLHCRTEGGLLATFDTREELAALSNYLISEYNRERRWWISATDYIREGTFYWHSTARLIGYADWSTDQPDNNEGNENCVHLWYQNSTYKMNDWICSKQAFYICEKEKPKSILLTVF